MPLSLQSIEPFRDGASLTMHFVLSVSTSLHMPGTSICLAVLVHLLADEAGIAHAQSVSTMLVTIPGVCCALPRPHRFLLEPCRYSPPRGILSSCFSEYATPDNLYGLVLASDVLLDRFVNLCNVHAHAILCHIVAGQLDAEDVETDTTRRYSAMRCSLHCHHWLQYRSLHCVRYSQHHN